MTGSESKSTILIVDDESFFLNVLSEMLADEYDVIVAKNGEQALRRASGEKRPQLVLLDVMMPVMDGYEVCRSLKANILTHNIPVIFLTAKSEEQDELKGFELGAVDYVTKPINRTLLKRRIETHMALAEQRFALENLVRERTVELERTKDSLVYSMGAMAEMRDKETGNHLVRTEKYVQVLAEGLARTDKYSFLDDKTIQIMHRAAPLHDIGKVGVSDSILQKSSALTEEERQLMELHPVFGRQLIEEAETKIGSTPFIRAAKAIAFSHHEWWNGEGYPQGLKGENIPLSARLMAVADVYDALASRRYYKDAMPHEEVVEAIRRESGTHFDPDAVAVFAEKNQIFADILDQYRDE